MSTQSEQGTTGTQKLGSEPNPRAGQEGQRLRLSQQREDLRFGIGLATGALIFSVTFIDKLAPIPHYKWLLFSGWVALLVSILAGIELLRRLHELEAISSEEFWKSLAWLTLGSLDKSVMIAVVAGYLTAQGGVGGETVEQKRVRLHREWEGLDPAELFTRLEKVCSTDPGLAALVPSLRFAVHLKSLSRRMTPEKMRRLANRTLVLSYYLPFVAIYSFYAGLLLIAIFSALNFLR
jgi:hypothetical protein